LWIFGFVFTCCALIFLLQIFTFIFFLLLLGEGHSLLLLVLSLFVLLVSNILCLRIERWIRLMSLIWLVLLLSLVLGLRKGNFIFIWVNIGWSFVSGNSSLLLLHFLTDCTVESNARHSTFRCRFGWALCHTCLCISIVNLKINSSYIDCSLIVLLSSSLIIVIARISCDSLLIHDNLLLCSESLCLRINEEKVTLVVNLVSEEGNRDQKCDCNAGDHCTLSWEYLNLSFVLGLSHVFEGRILGSSVCRISLIVI